MQNDDMIDLHFMEGGAYMESNSMDLALEQFFNNVLECIVLDEEMFCSKE